MINKTTKPYKACNGLNSPKHEMDLLEKNPGSLKLGFHKQHMHNTRDHQNTQRNANTRIKLLC